LIQLAYDVHGVTLTFQSRRTLLDRLRQRLALTTMDQDRRLDLALADLRSTAEEVGDEVEIEEGRIRMTHRTVAGLSSDTATALGLPPLVDLTLRTDVKGIIGAPDFRLSCEWIRAGRQEVVRRTGALLQTSGASAKGLRRIPGWMLQALEVADGFQGTTGLDEHWEALARFRRALEPGVQMNPGLSEARLAMTDFLSGLEVTLADRFSISPRTIDQFDIVPFSAEGIERAEGERGEVSEQDAELDGAKLHTFRDKVFARGARPAYKLSANAYLVVDPSAAPVLGIMATMQKADAATRAAFIENPRQKITEVIEEHLRIRGKLSGLSPEQEQELIEQEAEPAFVETVEYSEYSKRVIGVTVYERPTIDHGGSTTTWLPEIFTGDSARSIEVMPPEQLRTLIGRLNEAIAQGLDTLDLDGQTIPATPASRDELVRRLEQITETGEKEREPADVPETGAKPERGTRPIIVDTAANLEEIGWRAISKPRTALVPDDLPKVVQTALKTHQLESFQWKLAAWKAGLPGVLNADEQGLGKTLQAIAFLAWIQEHLSQVKGPTRPVLVVAPTSLLVNWEEEVDRHLRPPALGNVIRLYGSALDGKKKPNTSGMDTADGVSRLDFSDLHEAIRDGRGHRYWILTTYTTLTNYQHSLARIPFSTAVFDEIQTLKNPVSLRTKAALAVNADFRIGLTGTPIENSTVDLWAILEQIVPGGFGSLAEFRKQFGEPDEGNMQRLHSLLFEPQHQLPAIGLRRLKEQVAKDLPEKSRRLHPGLMPDVQATVYDEARRKLASGTRGAALKMLHHIRSVSVHPNAASMADDQEYITMSARLQETLKILREISRRRERALVFIEHIRMQYRFIELLKREFQLETIDLINGNTPIARRQEIVTRFQQHLVEDRGFDVLVLGPKAAGTGLTLTAATHVIHLSRWWNPAVEEQCNDRVHRIGQTRPVTVHLPMAVHPDYQHNSFDCLLHNLMTRKRRLASSALWPMGDTDEDAARLQQSLADESTTLAPDPVNAAMVKMFERDALPAPQRNSDGSISFS
jgi:superfamily II DNA or RNA helicase